MTDPDQAPRSSQAEGFENRGATILGPRNPAVEAQNPDQMAAPSTDAGTVPNLKFPYAAAHNRVLSGGWAREVTTRELPVATEMAGVNMRLTPGGIRELHWHKEAEWAYMIAGSVRISVLNELGQMFTDDLGVGDLWYFPPGLPHSIQAFEDGAEFVLVFDDGGFSENETFLLTDWFEHTPREVLAKNFGVDRSVLDALPQDIAHTRYLFGGDVPSHAESGCAVGPAGAPAERFSHHMLAQKSTPTAAGQVRITDSSNFPISVTIAAALVEVPPGAIRELHWHSNSDEWQYYLAGEGRMTVFASGGSARTFDYRAGDVGYVPFAMGHYVENTGSETLVFLEMFRSDRYADVSLRQWMALLPPQLVKAHLNLDDAMIAGLPRDKPIIVR